MRWLIFAAVVVCATWAAAADLQGQISPPGTDGQVELAWDNGTSYYSMVWYTGPHNWIGVDFDISAIQSYRTVDLLRVYSRATWPNAGWDGFRVGLFAMAGSAPGSALWGPTWVTGTSSSVWWVDAPVNYTLPAGTDAFVAAMTQYYSYPNCDCFTTDNNRTPRGHSWERYGTTWRAYTSGTGYSNVMIRVVVDNATSVLPTSLGRVKATYF